MTYTPVHKRLSLATKFKVTPGYTDSTVGGGKPPRVRRWLAFTAPANGVFLGADKSRRMSCVMMMEGSSLLVKPNEASNLLHNAHGTFTIFILGHCVTLATKYTVCFIFENYVTAVLLYSDCCW